MQMEQTFQTKLIQLESLIYVSYTQIQVRKLMGRVSSIDYFIIVFAPFL